MYILTFTFLITIVLVWADEASKLLLEDYQYCKDSNGTKRHLQEIWAVEGVPCHSYVCLRKRVSWYGRYDIDVAVPFMLRCFDKSEYKYREMTPSDYRCVTVPSDDRFPYPHCCEMYFCRDRDSVAFVVHSFVFWKQIYVNRKGSHGDYHKYY